MWYQHFSFNGPRSQFILIDIEKEIFFIKTMNFLIRETVGVGKNCENLWEAKAYELVSLSHGDFAESKESSTMLFYVHLHYVLHYSSFYDELRQYHKKNCPIPPAISQIPMFPSYEHM